MNFKKVMAGVVAGSMVAAMGITAFAEDASTSTAVEALLTKTGNTSSAEKYVVDFSGLSEDEVASIASIVADISVDSGFCNGTIGANVDGNWSSLSDASVTDVAGQFVWDVPGSLVAYDDDGNLAPYAEIQIWWVNPIYDEDGNEAAAGTASLDAVTLYDASGNVVRQFPTVVEEDSAESGTTEGIGQTRAENGVYRLNLYNSWTSDANDMIIDPEITKEASKLSVTFSVEGLGSKTGTASINFSADGWSKSFWGEDQPENMKATVVDVTADGTYVISIETLDGSAIGTLDFADVQTDIAVDEGEEDLVITSGFKLSVLSVDTVAVGAEEATEAPAETTTEAPAETTTEAPAETTTEAPAETTTEAPAETTTEAPAETTTEAPVYDESKVNVVVGDVTAVAGSEVKVPVQIVSNPGIASIKVAVSYDDTVLTLKGVENGEIFAEGNFQGSEFTTDNPYVLLYVDGVNPDTTATGVLAYLVFDVNKDFTGTIPVGINVSGIVNSDLDAVAVEETKAGNVVVTESSIADAASTEEATTVEDSTTVEEVVTTEAEAEDVTTTAEKGDGNETGDRAPVVPFAVAVVLMGAAAVCVKKFGLN